MVDEKTMVFERAKLKTMEARGGARWGGSVHAEAEHASGAVVFVSDDGGDEYEGNRTHVSVDVAAAKELLAQLAQVVAFAEGKAPMLPAAASNLPWPNDSRFRGLLELAREQGHLVKTATCTLDLATGAWVWVAACEACRASARWASNEDEATADYFLTSSACRSS